MVNFLEAIYTLVERHGNTLKEFAIHEANAMVFKLSLQLSRLRTNVEQRALLDRHYHEILAVLQALDEGPFAMIFHIGNLMPQASINVEQVSAITQRFSDVFGKTNVFKTMDFTDLVNAGLEAIPKDSIALPVLEVYKAYAINEHVLERITETLDYLDANEAGKKLTAAQLQKNTSPDELRELINTTIQQTADAVAEQERHRFDKPYLNMSEAAAYLNMPKASLYNLTSKRAIPFTKPGKYNLFRKEELDGWVAKGRKGTVEEIKGGLAKRKLGKK